MNLTIELEGRGANTTMYLIKATYLEGHFCSGVEKIKHETKNNFAHFLSMW